MILLDQCVPNKFQRIIQSWSYQVDLLSQYIALTDLYRDDLRHVLLIVEAHRYRIRKP